MEIIGKRECRQKQRNYKITTKIRQERKQTKGTKENGIRKKNRYEENENEDKIRTKKQNKT